MTFNPSQTNSLESAKDHPQRWAISLSKRLLIGIESQYNGLLFDQITPKDFTNIEGISATNKEFQRKKKEDENIKTDKTKLHISDSILEIGHMSDKKS